MSFYGGERGMREAKWGRGKGIRWNASGSTNIGTERNLTRVTTGTSRSSKIQTTPTPYLLVLLLAILVLLLAILILLLVLLKA